jgi:serpin B
MLARGLRLTDLVPASATAKGTRLRGIGAALVAVIVAGACGSAVATPPPAAGTPSAPTPTNSATPAASPSPAPATAEPTPSLAVPTPYLTQDPNGGFAIALGRAPLLALAGDNGSLAGTEVNAFGFDLLRSLDPKGNLCASPASIALVLAMVRPGARGATAAEMDKVLHDFGAPGQAAEIVSLLQALKSGTSYDDTDPQATPNPSGPTPVVELDVSNAVFSQKGMSLQPAYLDSLSSGFGAGLGLLDYAKDPEGARQIINQWASDRTKGRIPAVLQPGDVNALTRIALANAIYLKAGWQYQFDPKDTTPLPFTRDDGSKVSVPTMAMDRLLNYSAGSGYRAVTLPFTGSGTLAMTIVVPDDMASFVGGLTAAKLAAIEIQGSRYDVDLTLPRFSVETRTDLASTLAAMGMPALFDQGAADLSGITTDEKLYIAKVIHQANIDVVEQGTTAAAVTVAVGMATTGGGESLPQPVQFHVDRPFLYFIQEQSTGTVLFMGRVVDPSAKN